MSNSCDEHYPIRVIDGVDDPEVADANPEVVAAGELDGAARTRLGAKGVNRLADSLTHRPLEAAVRACGLGVKANLVHGPSYPAGSRTSLQGTLESRSSRAVSAARLSSR